MLQYSDEELLRLDPELDALFKKRGPPKIPYPTKENVGQLRKGFAATMRRFNESAFAKSALGDAYDNPTWTETDRSIPVRNGRVIKVRLYVPKSRPDEGVPVVIFLHAGGWFMGDLDTEAFTCRLFSAKLGVIAIAVDFGLHPEVPFGVPQTDSYDACKWVAANAPNFGGNLETGFIVGGNSGGGTWASIAVHLARDEGLQPPITGCYLTGPILGDEYKGKDGELLHLYDQNTEYRSKVQCANVPLMDTGMEKSIGGNLNLFAS